MSDTLSLTFDTAEFERGLNSAITQQLVQTRGRAALTVIARRIQAAAQQYCPVDTGRLKGAIVVGPVEKRGTSLSVTVGVTMASLQNSSAAAQKKIDRNVGQLLRGKRTSLGISKQTELRAGPPAVNYAGFVEFGTRKMAAQPFMRPAIAQTLSRPVFGEGK